MKYPKIFRTRTFRIALLLLVAAAIFFRHGGRLSNCRTGWKGEAPEITLTYVKKIFPNAVSFNRAEEPYAWGEVYNGDGAVIGGIICTSPYADDICGYAGAVPLLIGVDRQKSIAGLHLLSNAETERVIAQLKRSGFFDSWNGLTAAEALGKKVDAVTGATVTSFAVIASVRKRLGQLSGGDTAFQWSGRGRVAEKTAAAAVLLFAFISFIMPDPLRRYRWCLAVLSVLVLGFLNGCSLSLKLFYSWFVAGVPWTVSPVLVVIAVLAVGVPLYTGRNFYCAHVCPYGFAQELAGKLRGAFRKRAKKAGSTKPAINTMRMIRRIFFAVIMIALLAGIHFHLDLVEPFSAFLFRYAPRFVLWLAGIFLLVSVFLPRFWCRCLCPTGQLLDIFSRRKR